MLGIKNGVYIVVFFLLALASCKKTQPGSTVTWNDTLIAYAPVPVTKSVSKRVFAHILPWFESNLTNNYNGGNAWGIHWTGGTNSSNQPYFDAPSQIASHYYPLIGPYASGDTNVIDYQLLLMKLSGIDGVFIDWPGLQNYSDFSMNVQNSNTIISRLGKAGLKYAIVYEDHNLQYTNSTISQAQADMSYIQANYFSDPNYEEINGAPLLLDFGPQTLTTASDWTQAFSVFTIKPAFFTLQDHIGYNETGEFGWVEQDTLAGLRSFYSSTSNPGIKISAGIIGYNSIYAEEPGNTSPTWVVNPTLSIFQQSITLALQQVNNNYIQLVTWNDYGEGTMIEPTTQFQYSFLTDLQQQLGVQSSLSVADLQAVANLYSARVNNSYTNYNPNNLNELNQIYYDIVSLKMDSAKALLTGF
jgi:hypothetical protein